MDDHKDKSVQWINFMVLECLNLLQLVSFLKTISNYKAQCLIFLHNFRPCGAKDRGGPKGSTWLDI